jgi:hypothetical protein
LQHFPAKHTHCGSGPYEQISMRFIYELQNQRLDDIVTPNVNRQSRREAALTGRSCWASESYHNSIRCCKYLVHDITVLGE